MHFNQISNQSLSPSFSNSISTPYKILTYLLAGILAFSGVAKLVDASGLLRTLQQVSFQSDRMIILTATLFWRVDGKQLRMGNGSTE